MSAYSHGSNKSTLQRLSDVGNFWQDPDANFNQFYGNAMSILSRIQGVEILALGQLPI